MNTDSKHVYEYNGQWWFGDECEQAHGPFLNSLIANQKFIEYCYGRGAAYDAATLYGAKYGVGEGLTGSSYAIPTKDHNIQTRSLDEIKISVDTFLKFAYDNPTMEFMVTRIGCGLAGYKDEQIGPMFKGAPSNCILPPEWKAFL